MLIAANWKMNLDKNSIKYFSEQLNKYKFNDNVSVCIFPPTIFIDYLAKLLKDTSIFIGGQSCHYEASGAHTGETSALFLKEFRCKYVLAGHSERRQYNNETNFTIKKCAQAAIKFGLTPIICVGEDIEDHKNGNTLKFIMKQVLESLPENFDNLLVAYEPVWSIGSGNTPSSIQIQEINQCIKDTVFSQFKKNIKVLYGGSVNGDNITDILSANNLDGVLVGGASVKIKDFLAIYRSIVKNLNNST